MSADDEGETWSRDNVRSNSRAFRTEPLSKVFWLDTNASWNDQLRYASGMKPEVKLCAVNPEHAVRQRWPRPLRLRGPIKAQHDWEATVYSDFVVSPEVADCIQEQGLTGAAFQEVQIVDTTGVPVSRSAYELRVWGWGGIAPPQSGIQTIEECSFCKFAVFSSYTSKANVFSAKDWDGSDFFVIWPMPRYVFITNKVRELIGREDWSGVAFRPLAELPDDVSGTFTPGVLQDWLEETASIRKAHERMPIIKQREAERRR